MTGIIGIVEYLPQLNAVKQTGDLFIGGIQLVAGRNEVDMDKWREVADYPGVKARKEQGILRVTFDRPTVIAAPEAKKSVRNSVPVETNLESEIPASPVVPDASTSVSRPPEIEKTPTAPIPSKK